MKLKFILVLLIVLGFAVGCSFPKIHITTNSPSLIKAIEKQRLSKTNSRSSIKAKDKQYISKTNSRPYIKTREEQRFLKTNIHPLIKVKKKQRISKTNIKNKGKWIIPSHSICKRKGGINDKGGRIYNNGCMVFRFSDAKAICAASGGSLPSIDMLKKEVTDCGGYVADILNRKAGNFFANLSKNRNNLNYYSCYRQKGFISSSPYWSKSKIDSKNVVGIDFSMGSVNIIDAFSKATVLCVR